MKKITRALSAKSTRLWLSAILGLLLITIVSVVVVLNLPSTADKKLKLAQSTSEETDSTSLITPEPQSPYPPRQTRQAWYGLNANEVNVIKGSDEFPPNTDFVKLTGDYEKWLLGTPVEILIPQIAKKFEAQVDRITPDGFGNTTIYASPKDGDADSKFRQLILTYNTAAALAYVLTDEGSYEMTQLADSDDIAHIIPTDSLHNQQDFTLEDTGTSIRDRHSDAIYVPKRQE